MRVAFLTGGLEPGRDGVGDYARLLAQALEPLGIEAGLVALDDRHVGAATTGTAGPCSTLRLPDGATWEAREAGAAAWLARFDPDWLSLQFVPYGYSRRGLVGAVRPRLQRLARSRRLQVMFHELWIGIPRGSRLRDRLLGLAQRREVLGLVRGLRPSRVHTHAPAYQAELRRHGIEANLLPLFSNIPVAPVGDREAGCRAVLERVGAGWVAERRAQTWLIAHFGTLHPEFDAESLAGVLQAAARHRRTPVFLMMGQAGAAGEAGMRRLEQVCGTAGSVVKTGFLQPAEVSWVLGASDFGLTSTPPDLVEKSGTAAAAFLHGLPVLVARGPLSWPRGTGPFPADSRLILREQFESMGDRPAGRVLGDTVENVAARFAESLRATV